MKTCLITGGAGFIGSHLADELLSRNCRVVVLDNLSLGRKSNLTAAITNPNFKFVKGDILDEDTLNGVFAQNRFDMVFHLAANSDIARSHANPEIDLNMTFLTTFRVLEAMRRHNVKRLMFASTSAIYGQTGGAEVGENYGPLFPASHYGACKLASEGVIASFAENYGIQAFITRFPNVCGERTTHGILHDFVKKLRQTRLNWKSSAMANRPSLTFTSRISSTPFCLSSTAPTTKSTVSIWALKDKPRFGKSPKWSSPLWD